ncbi:MAG: cupin domain-containing protein [Acidimicrobiaceae bacterium]|nr:cupin domain-containing protein [Acidimicrobiaceae bacterium]
MTRNPLLQPSADLIVNVDDVGRRIIEPHQFMADTEAFIDVRLPGSVGKASYSFIGPGVSQNADQIVNLAEPHGFNIGAASMPHGVVNNPHMHYTAEVFICTRGRWEMRLGQHGEQTVEIGPNTLFSVPTWIFRGFKNIGDDDGWLLTVLGSDNTGGILWAPQVLEAAALTGLYLSPVGAVLDATAGDLINDTITPIDETRLGELDHYTDAEIAERIVASDRLDWSEAALLSSVLPGHGSAIAPVIGFGLTEDRQQRPPIWTPHGFTVEWLRLEPGASTGLHRIDQNQALFLVEGEWQVTYNRLDNQISRTVTEDTVVSIPGNCWRDLTNTGSAIATCLVVCAGDNRARADWDPWIGNAAAEAGWGRDANGYIAPLDLLGGTPW